MAADMDVLDDNFRHHFSEMEDWASGRKSYTNMIDDKAVCAVMDAQEVVKHAAAAQAYAFVMALGRNSQEGK